MNIKIEEIKKCRVAYFRGVGPYGISNIKVMENLKKWAEEKKLFGEEAIIYGIPQDNPQTTVPKDCRYDACIVISNDYQMDDSINEGEINGGEYAVYKIKHTEEDIKKAWKEVFTDLQSTGYKIDNKPIIERYSKDMVNKGYCEICVPIKKL